MTTSGLDDEECKPTRPVARTTSGAEHSLILISAGLLFRHGASPLGTEAMIRTYGLAALLFAAPSLLALQTWKGSKAALRRVHLAAAVLGIGLCAESLIQVGLLHFAQ